MKNKDIIFTKSYEVLVREDTDSEYIGQNSNGDYILGFIVDELPEGNELHLYIIAHPADLIQYFNRQKSSLDIANSALNLYEVEKNIAGEIVNAHLISKTQLQTEYAYLQDAFYLIQPPRCLPEIEAKQFFWRYTQTQQNAKYQAKIEEVTDCTGYCQSVKQQVEIKGQLTNNATYWQDTNYSFAA